MVKKYKTTRTFVGTGNRKGDNTNPRKPWLCAQISHMSIEVLLKNNFWALLCQDGILGKVFDRPLIKFYPGYLNEDETLNSSY